MLKLNKFSIISLGLFFVCAVSAEKTIAEVPQVSTSDVSPGEGKDPYSKIKETLGVTYFSYFYGPGFHPDNRAISPNQLGLPDNDGIYLQNQVSMRYKFSKNLAFDFQSRFKVILNNAIGNDQYTVFRWETPRIGISGKLFSRSEWTLIGAVNTDPPHFTPSPFTGYQAQQRKVVFTPGMFASLRYEPKNSRWSFFSVVAPRYFIYEDRNAAESQLGHGGFSPANKPEFIIAFQPTLNYQVSSNAKLTLGTSVDYRKYVCSDWNILNASLITNGDDPAWRLTAVPIYIGVTYTISSYLTIFPYFGTYPIAAQRVDARTGAQATFLQATSMGMWISGTLF